MEENESKKNIPDFEKNIYTRSVSTLNALNSTKKWWIIVLFLLFLFGSTLYFCTSSIVNINTRNKRSEKIQSGDANALKNLAKELEEIKNDSLTTNK